MLSLYIYQYKNFIKQKLHILIVLMKEFDVSNYIIVTILSSTVTLSDRVSSNLSRTEFPSYFVEVPKSLAYIVNANNKE